MHARQFSSVSPSMPAIRSMLICGNASDRANAYARPISGDRCARPLSSRISSLKFSTPRLRRVTPMPRIDASFASVNVPGSHSKVTSSASRQEVTASRRDDEPLELFRREERGRSAAEVHEVQRTAGDLPEGSRRAPTRAPARRGSRRLPARSCPCRRGSSRSGTASGRTECGGTTRAEHPEPVATRAPGGRRTRPPPCVHAENGGYVATK